MKTKSFFLIMICICFLPQSGSAMKPTYDSYGMFSLQYEYGDYSIFTQPRAIADGVETWYIKYASYINTMTIYGTYYDYLPVYGYTTVTPDLLASEIWVDPDLGLGSDIPFEVYYDISGALQNDLDNGYRDHVGEYSELFMSLQWRVSYMESRKGENNSTDQLIANCWGTADYLAKDYEWVDGYAYGKQLAFDNGCNTVNATFPHIYLDGGKYYPGYPNNPNASCIDDDLSGANSNSVFKSCGAGRTVTPANILNSFDVIRLSENPSDPNSAYYYEMKTDLGNGVNVGENLHCVAYICTDQSGQSWVYEKHNWGATRYCPYGLNILGYDQWTSPVSSIGSYNFSYNSYFKKYGYNKQNLASSFDQNYPGITP